MAYRPIWNGMTGAILPAFAALNLAACNPVAGESPVRVGRAFLTLEQLGVEKDTASGVAWITPSLQAKPHPRSGKLVYGPDFTLDIPAFYDTSRRDPSPMTVRLSRVTLTDLASGKVVYRGATEPAPLQSITPLGFGYGVNNFELPARGQPGLTLAPVDYELTVETSFIHSWGAVDLWTRSWRFVPAPAARDGLSGGRPARPAAGARGWAPSGEASPDLPGVWERDASWETLGEPVLDDRETQRLLTLEAKVNGSYRQVGNDPFLHIWDGEWGRPTDDPPAERVARLGLEGPEYARLKNRTILAIHDARALAYRRFGPVVVRVPADGDPDALTADYPNARWTRIPDQPFGNPYELRLTMPPPVDGELYPELTLAPVAQRLANVGGRR